MAVQPQKVQVRQKVLATHLLRKRRRRPREPGRRRNQSKPLSLGGHPKIPSPYQRTLLLPRSLWTRLMLKWRKLRKWRMCLMRTCMTNMSRSRERSTACHSTYPSPTPTLPVLQRLLSLHRSRLQGLPLFGCPWLSNLVMSRRPSLHQLLEGG